MKLKNTFIFTGNYSELKSLHDDLLTFKTKKTQAHISTLKESKKVKNLVVGDLTLEDTNYSQFGIHFDCKHTTIKKIVDYFQQKNSQVVYSCESEKANIWIVDKRNDILNYKLIPYFAAIEIIADYIEYTEHSIITDQHNTIKLERNKLIYNDHAMTKGEVRKFFNEAFIKNKSVIFLLEQFILDYHRQCLNSFEQLDKLYGVAQQSDEKTSVIALLGVSLSIFIIIYIIASISGVI